MMKFWELRIWEVMGKPIPCMHKTEKKRLCIYYIYIYIKNELKY